MKLFILILIVASLVLAIPWIGEGIIWYFKFVRAVSRGE
jgi:hypothetical protein